MPAEWLLGVGLCLAGAAFTNLGLTLQKLSFIRLDALSMPDHAKPHSFLQPLWLLGFSLFLFGQVGGMVAMGFSSQSVVATLGSFSLVTNAVFAPLVLGEQMTWMLVASIVVIMSGSAIVVLSSNHDAQDYSLPQLLALFRRDLFTLYASLLALCLLLCIAQMVREHRRHAREKQRIEEGYTTASIGHAPVDDSRSINVSVSIPPSPRKPLLSPSSSFASSPSSDEGVSPTSPMSPPPSTTTLSALTPTLTAAILSSISVLLGKCTMQLLKTTFTTADNQFRSPVSFVITAVFLTAAIASVHLLNTGLRRGTALFVVPFYYVASTSLAIGGGMVYFEEFKTMGWAQCVVFFGGVGLTVLGVWISTRGQMEEEEREREEIEEEEEGTLEEQAETVEEAETRMRAEEDGVMKGAEREEHKSSSSSPRRSLSIPSSASPTSASPRSQASPRSAYLPGQPVIAEEDVLTSPPAALSAAAAASAGETEDEEYEEDKEVAKRRAWHSKRAVSEPGITFIMSTPSSSKGEQQPPVEQYGTFTSQTASAASSQPSSSASSPTHMARAAAASSSALRLGRTQSLSLSLGDATSHPATPLSTRHQLSRAVTSRASLARRSYTPHYTLAWYPVLPSNAQTARRKRSVSVAGSRQLSPSGTPTRQLRL